MLRLDGIAAGYGRTPVLEAIDLEVAIGETIAVGGPNGAGKSTLLKVIAGALAVQHGSLCVGGNVVTDSDVRARARLGIILCPEGRQIFSSLSIEENLLIGAIAAGGRTVEHTAEMIQDDLEKIYTLFPILKERRRQSGGALSGGQQQMLAIGRALMGRPSLLLLDEPSLGLSPLIADEIYAILAGLQSERKVAMIIVEEAAGRPLAIADRGLLLRHGRIVRSGDARSLSASSDFTADYLGHSA